MNTHLKMINAQALKAALHDGAEIALLDAREEVPYDARHLLMASCVPLSRLELIVDAGVPHRDTRVVWCDDGEGLADHEVDLERLDDAARDVSRRCDDDHRAVQPLPHRDDARSRRLLRDAESRRRLDRLREERDGGLELRRPDADRDADRRREFDHRHDARAQHPRPIPPDRKSTRLNSSHMSESRMPSSA